MNRWLALVAGLALFAACGQGQGTAIPGDALMKNYGGAELKGIPVGEQFVALDVALVNASSLPLTLQSVTVSGPGMGSVVRVLGATVGPIPKDPNQLTATPGGFYHSLPPVWFFTDEAGCRVQELHELRGFVLPPGGEARIALLQEAVAPGSFSFPGYEVTYEQAGRLFTQLLTDEERGSVVPQGPLVPPLHRDVMKKCAKFTRLLPPLNG